MEINQNNSNGKMPNIDEIRKANQTRTKGNTNKKIIILLSAIVAILLIANIVIVSLAFFTDKASSSASIEFGSIGIKANVQGQADNKITLDSNDLMAGAETTKIIDVTVTGKNECYIRMKGEFKVENTSRDFVKFSIVDPNDDTKTDENWRVYNDGYLYYNQQLNGTASAGGASTISIKLKIKVSEEFGNKVTDVDYANKPYNITIRFDACQSANTELKPGTEFDPSKFVTSPDLNQ